VTRTAVNTPIAYLMTVTTPTQLKRASDGHLATNLASDNLAAKLAAT